MSGKDITKTQSDWMGHWMQPKHKHSRDADLRIEKKDICEMKQRSLSCNRVSEPNGSKAIIASIEATESHSREVISKIVTDGSHSKKESSDLLSFPIFNINRRNQVPGTQPGQGIEFNAATTQPIKPHSAYAFKRQLQEMGITTIGCNMLPKETTPNLKLETRSRDSVEGGIMPALNPSKGKLPGVPIGYPYGVMYRNEKITPFSSTSKERITHHSSHYDVNVDTMRNTSTLDARKDIYLGAPMYTETTRHIFVTEKMEIAVNDEGKIFRESFLSTKFNGNLSGLLSLSPVPGQVQHRLKLQLLDASTDSEHEQKEIGSEVNEKGESSRIIGKLNTMKVGVSLEESQTYGLAVSGSNKALLQGQITASSNGKSAKILLPDINEVAHSPNELANQGEPSISRTQSLDMECLFSNNDFPSYSKPNPGHISQPLSELGSRWVKRLKLSKNAALGTKSSKVEETSSYEKLRKFSSSVFHRNVSRTHSEPSTETAEDPNQSNDEKYSLSDSIKEDRHALLSHSWIRRWRHDQSSCKKQSIPIESCETHNADFDHFQKKSFPSIAAMALMGKAMNGFRPCEFTKKRFLHSLEHQQPPQ